MELSDRMKKYESLTEDRLLVGVPILARLDGRSFHTFTKGMDRPYDVKLSDMMRNTMRYLCQESHALCGYTQSDEITLLWHTTKPESQMFFDGRVQKLCSVLAAMATVKFNDDLRHYYPDKVNAFPVFDCRVFHVPNETEAANCFVWREMDATRNSIQMLGQAHFSHKELHQKSCNMIQEMLFQEKGINWSKDVSDRFKRGSYARRVVSETSALGRPMSYYNMVAIPPILSIANREDVLFRGAAPILKESEDGPSNATEVDSSSVER
jgi:tRNA(His) guanylyltransferase